MQEDGALVALLTGLCVLAALGAVQLGFALQRAAAGSVGLLP